MNPGGGAGWDESPLDIQIPDDARELDRDVLAYHRELRAKRRRNRLRRLAGPFAGRGTIMPLLASILAVCLVAGAMLSVATFSPASARRSDDPAAHRPDSASRRRGQPPRPGRQPPGPALRDRVSPSASGPALRQRFGQRLRRPGQPLGEPPASLAAEPDGPLLGYGPPEPPR